MVLLELASFSVVVVVLLELLPPGAGALSVPDALPLTVPDAAGALPDDEELEDRSCDAGADDPWARTSDTGAASSATPSRAANKAFIPHLLACGKQQARCH
jgi:hypothetical protein